MNEEQKRLEAIKDFTYYEYGNKYFEQDLKEREAARKAKEQAEREQDKGE